MNVSVHFLCHCRCAGNFVLTTKPYRLYLPTRTTVTVALCGLFRVLIIIQHLNVTQEELSDDDTNGSARLGQFMPRPIWRPWAWRARCIPWDYRLIESKITKSDWSISILIQFDDLQISEQPSVLTMGVMSFSFIFIFFRMEGGWEVKYVQ